MKRTKNSLVPTESLAEAYPDRAVIGKRFGKLTLLGPAPPDKYKIGTVIAVCDCGVTKTYMLSNLKNGSTQSCGCARAEKAVMLAQAASAKKIKDIETGQEWNSLTEFAKEYGVSLPSVTQALKRKGRVAGIRLEFVQIREQTQ